MGVQEAKKEAKQGGNFFSTLKNNLVHTGSVVFYTAAGIATQRDDVPICGRVPYIVPIALFFTNVIARFDETNILLNDPKEIIHHRHEIMANYAINIGLSVTGAAIASYSPPIALPLLCVFAATDVLTYGDNSPIEQLKIGLASWLDNVLEW